MHQYGITKCAETVKWAELCKHQNKREQPMEQKHKSNHKE